MSFLKKHKQSIIDGLIRGMLWWIIVDFSISTYAEKSSRLFIAVIIICLALSTVSAIVSQKKQQKILVDPLISTLCLLLCIFVDSGLRILHYHLFLFPVRLIPSGESIFVFLGPVLFLVIDLLIRLILIGVKIVDRS